MTRLRAHLAVNLAVVVVTAWGSYAYFHIDEYFQVLELVWFKLGVAPSWALPWEHAARMRPWMQPFLYWVLARGLGVFGARDVFTLAFAFRLATGLACWGALALFLRTTLPWFRTEDARRLHLRVATLLGFLPYLFVRTSSETLSMAAFTAGFSVVCAGARPDATEPRRWDLSLRPRTALLGGALVGLAFELRFQTALLALGLVAWLAVVTRSRLRALAPLALGAAAVVALGALVDRWGYGAWTFPAWTYVKANLFEGAAGMFGREPPFAYLWLSPANLFAPVVIALIVLALLAWARCPRHPITWATLPFVVVHCLLAHKEERFLFPIAILATAFVAMATAPAPAARPGRWPAKLEAAAAWGWAHRRGALAKALAAWSTVMALALACWPIGWHHHVRFQRHVHDALGGELRAYALPSFDLGLPAFHGRVYDVDKEPPAEIARRLDEGRAREWLVADTPRLMTGVPSLDARAELVWSELPFFDEPAVASIVLRAADAYDAWARPPLRPIRFRSLYRLQR